ncbi:MAG TPA: hypothetical protein DIU40_05015 [Ruminococcaceae bacterium]|nr:hypothetical protein [Oscillospiraceae bacterium]
MSLTHKTNTKNSREIGCFLYNKIYSYKNYAQLFLQGKPLTYRAFFDIIAQNKYRTDVLCNLFLFILCVNDII